VQVLLPFVIFPLYSAMARIDPSFMQAALTLGASPTRAFFRVYLPLTLPGLMTGATSSSSARSATTSPPRCWGERVSR
jgi:putative spermidine/putrescine transport system permease protein